MTHIFCVVVHSVTRNTLQCKTVYGPKAALILRKKTGRDTLHAQLWK